jgi:hypothetical protein
MPNENNRAVSIDQQNQGVQADCRNSFGIVRHPTCYTQSPVASRQVIVNELERSLVVN